MKIKLILPALAAMSLFGANIHAQSASVTATAQLQVDKQPLVIINNDKTTFEYFDRYKDLMDDVRVIKEDEAVKLYGKEAKDGVIIANSIKTVRFLSFDKIIKGVTLTDAQKKLPVAVDGELKSNPKLILLKADDFHYVEVKENLLNIVTRK